MSISFTIAGVDFKEYLDIETVEITAGLAARGDALTFSVRIPRSALAAGLEKPRGGQVVVLTANATKEFEGPIISTSDQFINPETMLVTCDCIDYTKFLDRHLVVKYEYPVEKAGERIKKILKEFAEPFATDLSYVEEGFEVPAAGYDYQSVSSVIDSLAEAIGFRWYVDFEKRVHFFAEETYVSPLATNYNNELDLDTNPEIGGVSISIDCSQIQNVVIIKDFSRKADYKYTYKTVADGETSFFSLPYEPFDLEGTRVWVSSDGGLTWNERTLELDPLDGAPETIEGVAGRAYLCIINWGLRFPTVDLPGADDIVKVEFDYVMPEQVMVFMDYDSIKEFGRREGSDGQYEVVVSLPEFRVKEIDPIEFYARLLLERRAWPQLSGSFTTMRILGWQPGQFFFLKSDVRDIFDVKKWVKSGWEVKEPLKVWVHKVTKRLKPLRGEVRLEEEVEFTNAYLFGI